MRRTSIFAVLLLAAAWQAGAQLNVTRVVDDAKAIDRVAEASRRDLPIELLKRIVNDDIELLRGHRADDTYLYASYERMETGRSTGSYSVQTSEEGKFTKFEVKGAFVYKVIVGAPSRRMIVTKNRPVWIERVDIEYMPQTSSTTKKQSVPLQMWLTPGSEKSIDIDEIARQATVQIYARADKKNGYANLDVSLVKARVFDNPDSPYADAVASSKAIVRGLDHNDVPSVRAMAQRLQLDLVKSEKAVPAVVAAVPTVAPVAAPAQGRPVDVVAPAEGAPTMAELQEIEDLLTGNDAERRQGMDRLHQLVRRMRSK